MSDALIVVDVQNGFTKFGNLASPLCLEAIPRVVEEILRARRRGDHLIYTADTHRPGDLEFEMFPEHCLEGSDEADIVDEVKPYLEGATVIRKRRYSAFHDSELGRVIADLGPKTVTVCGFCTDICVMHTVADLRNRDIDVRVPAGAVATFDVPGHLAGEANRWALAHMRDVLGAEIVEAT